MVSRLFNSTILLKRTLILFNIILQVRMTKEKVTLQTRFVVTFTVSRGAQCYVSLHFNARENAVFPVISFPDIPVLSQKLNGFTFRRDIGFRKAFVIC